MKNFRKNQGITLIALVITVIVLLILAGVTIATLTGDNGILTRTQEAKNKTEQAEDIEKIKLAISEAQIGENGYQKLDVNNFQEALNSQFEGRFLQLSDNGDGSFIIKLDNMSKSYYADNNGKIIGNENMFAIGTAEELKAFRNDVNSGNTYEGCYVYLTNNITLDINEEWKPIGIYQSTSTNPDDEINRPFKGIFDGGFNTISGIYGKGLFGLIKEATIKNVGIVDGNINGTARIGAVIGYAYQNSKIINCYNSSDIKCTNNFVGGIVGFIKDETIIEGCYNKGKVSSSGTVGGIAGGIDNSSIKNCYNTGVVEGTQVGGISSIAYNNVSIENCYNVGNLKGTTLALSINNTGNSSTIFKNNYYLENTVNESNDIYPQEECKVKNSQEMKGLHSVLGKAYEEDTANINNGYPILTWQ